MDRGYLLDYILMNLIHEFKKNCVFALLSEMSSRVWYTNYNRNIYVDSRVVYNEVEPQRGEMQ
jgi:hypothetical protein